MLNRITIKIIEEITFEMAREQMEYDEPIPDFATRRPHILESCIAAPFQTYGGKFLYPKFYTRTSMLFYLLIKNHPFENGNKRIAITTMLVFLYLNDKWIHVENQELYEFTKWIAASRPQFKEEAVKAIEKFLQTYAKKIPARHRFPN